MHEGLGAFACDVSRFIGFNRCLKMNKKNLFYGTYQVKKTTWRNWRAQSLINSSHNFRMSSFKWMCRMKFFLCSLKGDRHFAASTVLLYLASSTCWLRFRFSFHFIRSERAKVLCNLLNYFWLIPLLILSSSSFLLLLNPQLLQKYFMNGKWGFPPTFPYLEKWFGWTFHSHPLPVDDSPTIDKNKSKLFNLILLCSMF